MKKRKMKGFTLVELLAVIVILAIILVIAVPKVMSVIEDAKKATLESTAKMIASQAEKQKVQNTVLGNDAAITCEGITNINDVDYASCEITFEDNTAKVTIKGSGKFNGLWVCNGTKTNATAINESCGLRTLTVNLDGGTVSENRNGKYEAGSEVTLIEPTKEGYTFNGWTVSGAGASVNGNTLTMGSEATTVTATWEEEQTSVAVGEFGTDSWETIVAAVRQAETNGTEYPYSVGNEKTIEMDIDGNGTAEQYTIRVANKTKCSSLQTWPVSKTACGFVLEFKDIITTHEMNGDPVNFTGATNVGGWPASEMRAYLNDLDANATDDGVIYNAIPEALRNGIIDTYVVSSYGSDKTTGVVENENAGVLASELYWSNDKLYLLSPQEVYGTSFTSSNDKSNGTSRQLDYYEDNNVTTSSYSLAIKNDSSGSASSWWLRSARSNGSNDFYGVSDNGYWSYNYSYGGSGVSPAFRLAN